MTKNAFPTVNPVCHCFRRVRDFWILLLMLLFGLPAVVQAQFIFKTINRTVTITKYTGTGGAVTIPSTTNGYPVTSIGPEAFSECTSLSSLTIGTNVTSIEDWAFQYCSNLTSVTMPN